MKKGLRSFTVILMVLALIIGLNGCQKKNAVPAGDGSSAIEFWVWNDDEQLSRRVVDAYQAEFPNRKVNVTMTPVREYADKLIAALAANAGPDVMCIDGNALISEYISRKLILNLDDYIKKGGIDLSIYGDNFNDQVRFQGSLYSLPYRSSVWVIAYNKTMFQERGVPLPTDDMTWEQIFETGRKMTFGSGPSKTYGLHFHTRNDDYLLPAFQHGFTFLDDDFSLVRTGMEMKNQAVKEGISLPHGEIKSTGLGVRPAFEQKRTAVYFTGDWTINQMRNSKANGNIDFDWDFAALPHLTGEPAQQSHGAWVHTAVNARSKSPEAAYHFTQYFAGVQGATIFAAGGTLPAAKYHPEVRTAFIGDRSLPPQNIEVLFKENVHQPEPITPGLNQIKQIFLEESELVFIGEKSIDDGIKAIQSRRAEVIKNNK
ncbi:sugar ABC transporter substrate-binding protein [Spirochaetia bacterium]|nr:sugar ABC transporter substrate-binding protein [Spirochaetia bacterium]